MNRDLAELIVDAIIHDLSGRRGLRHEWDQIDEDVQTEIRDQWIAIVMNGGRQ